MPHPENLRKGGGRLGHPNRDKAELRKQAKARMGDVIDEGALPLEVMLDIMRDETLPPDIRLKAAGEAAPYIHRKQPQDQTVEITVPKAIQIVTPWTPAPLEE